MELVQMARDAGAKKVRTRLCDVWLLCVVLCCVVICSNI